MPDEPTLGEVVRRLEAIHADLKEDIRLQGAQVDGKVSSDVFELRMAAMERDIVAAADVADAVRAAQEDRDRKRAADHRWIVTALVVPVLLVFVQAYLSTQGAGP